MNPSNASNRNSQGGFSIVELMIAMVVTLIVTGAVFGLLSGGQSAFKVQPERTDRQQNIRSALDLIIRDVASAGVGMPSFAQVFTPLVNGSGPAASPFGGGTDELQILANSEGFPNEQACNIDGNRIILRKKAIDFGAGTNVMLLFMDGSWTVKTADSFAQDTGAGSCTGADHVAVTLDGAACAPSATGLGNAGAAASINPTACGVAAGTQCCNVDTEKGLGFGEVIRYRINVDATGIPNLERSVNGGVFQIVARAIEDLQVQYLNQPGAVFDSAPVIDSLGVDFTTLITQVRVTLSARAVTPRLQGATYASGTANAALRGSLTAQITPREALATLTTETGTPKWN